MREHFENLYLNILENLEEIENFLDAFDQLNLNQEAINHIKRSIKSNEFEAVTLIQQKKNKDLMNSLLNSIRSLRKN
jgi:cell fate (sporulation/competence/biofilm development) regulator YmcA (YheA/YmcA/DUF963 family)